MPLTVAVTRLSWTGVALSALALLATRCLDVGAASSSVSGANHPVFRGR
jgi:hypothetical protein